MKPKDEEIELLPDAWERFERAAGVVAKSPPQHRKAKKEVTEKSAKRTAKPLQKRRRPKSRSRKTEQNQ